MKILKLFSFLGVILLMTSCNVNEELELEKDIITNSINECFLDCEIDEGGPGGGLGDDDYISPGWSNYFYTHRGESNNNIYYAESDDGSTWSTNQLGLGAQSSHGPASIIFKNKRFIYYKGNSSSKIFYTYKAGPTTVWQGNTWINSTSETDNSISAAVLDNKVFVAYKGKTNKALYLSYSSTGFGTYTQVQALPDSDKVKNFSIVSRNGTMYVFWTKSDDNDRLYYKTNSTPTNPNTWLYHGRITDISPENGVSAAVLNGKIYLATAFIGEASSKKLAFIEVQENPYNVDLKVYDNYNTKNRPGIMATDNYRLMINFADKDSGKIYTMEVNTNGDELVPPYESGGNTGKGGVYSYSKFN